MSNLRDKYVVVPTNKALNNVVFMCNRKECLKRKFDIDNSLLVTLKYTWTIRAKHEIIDHMYILCFFEFQPNRRNKCIFLHSIGYLNYIGVHNNIIILLYLPNALHMLFAVTVTLDAPEIVGHRCVY